MPGFFYEIGISYLIKMLRRDAHSRDGKMSQMRPRSARKAPRKNLQLIIKIIIYMEELT